MKKHCLWSRGGAGIDQHLLIDLDTMIYFKNIKALLGEAVDDVLNSVRNGDFSKDQITSVAQHLGESEDDKPNILYGNHRRRMEGNKNRDYSTEMKDILSDLYNQKLFEKTKEESLSKVPLQKMMKTYQMKTLKTK